MKLSYNLICQKSQGACNIRVEENTQLFPVFSWVTAGKRQSLKLHGLKLTRGRMYRWLKPSLHLPRRKTTVDFKKNTLFLSRAVWKRLVFILIITVISPKVSLGEVSQLSVPPLHYPPDAGCSAFSCGEEDGREKPLSVGKTSPAFRWAAPALNPCLDCFELRLFLEAFSSALLAELHCHPSERTQPLQLLLHESILGEPEEMPA